MTHAAMLNPEANNDTRAISRTASFASRFLFRIIVTLLIIPVSAIALLSGLGVLRLPYEMYLLAERVPVIFRLHMVASACALILLPLVISVRHSAHIHRPVGRALGIFVAIGGLTALPVAIMSSSGEIARAGFFVQGLVWMWLLQQGWQAIRARDLRRHADLMLMMGAVTTGAVWFRLITGTAIIFDLPFEPAYAFAAWVGWLAPLAAANRWAGMLAMRRRTV